MKVRRPRGGTVGDVRRTSRTREDVADREMARRESNGRAAILFSRDGASVPSMQGQNRHRMYARVEHDLVVRRM